jgi:hypothetical protein
MYPTSVVSAGLLVLRLVVGVTFLLHGLDKLGDFSGTEELFASLEIPAPGLMAPFVALTETAGGLLLIAGFATPLVGVVLTGAGRFSADAALDLPRSFQAVGTRTRDLTRHLPRRERARAGAKVTT